MWRQTNGDNRTTRADIFRGLLERLLGDSEKDHCMGTQSVRRCSLYVGDNIFGLGEVDVCLIPGLC